MNYQIILDETLKKLSGVPKLLLHACCAPCSSYCIEYLSDYFEITVYYYNPNIDTIDEYDYRYNELDRFIKEFTDSKIVTKQDFTGIREGEIQKENVFSDIPEEPLNYIRKWYTPGKVTSLKYNQIFVYGSNIYGSNGAGAARDAEDVFGAKSGIGEGRNGQCYAIPTMDGSVEAIKPYVDRFIEYAAQHKELEFLLTPIGCGIAGYTPQQIAPLFKEGLKYGNIVFPRPFIDVLIKK